MANLKITILLRITITSFQEMDNLTLRDQQYELLQNYFAQLRDKELFMTYSSSVLRIKRGLLLEAFDAFRRHHLNYRSEASGSMMFVRDLYFEVEEDFTRAMSKIDEHIEKTEEPRDDSITMDTSRVIRIETARPPKLITFDGNPAKWPGFHDLFIAEVHNREIDPVSKLLYLQESCIDKAAKTLGVWKPTAENYAAAWELLKQTYSDEYQIKQGIIDEIFQIKKLKEESYDGLRIILDTVASSLRQLKVLGVSTDSWDDIMINIITQRLPGATLDSWEQKRISILNPSLTDLQRLLESKARGRRAVEGDAAEQKNDRNHEQSRRRDNRYRPYPEMRPAPADVKPEGRVTDRGSNITKVDICPIEGCQLNHHVYRCDLFKKMNLNERMQIINRARLCRCCMRPGHMAAKCDFQSCSNCPEDVMKHNFRLCRKTNQSTGNYGTNNSS